MKIFPFLAIAIIFSSCDKTASTTTPNPTPVICNNPSKADLEKIKIFPTTNPLNTDISNAAVDSKSAAIISAIGSVSLHPDFGSGLWQGAPIGIPFSVVCGNQAKVPITFRANSYDGNYGNESDAGPYPVPLTAPIEGNGVGDSHVITVDLENGKLYEMYNASQTGNGWGASCGAIFDLNSNATRTEGFTSADAAGLPILPCLLRYDEVASGTIDHCIRFTLSKSKVFNGYVSPASHKVNGTGISGSSLPMGARLRLKASFNISTYAPNMQVILKAMKTYGIILADIGSDMFISGAPDSRWLDTEVQSLKTLKSTDFEVIQLGTIK